MHTILLTPQDTLFFHDARPMSGSLMGHTAYWPLPNIFNHALRSAFHRAELNQRATSEKYGSLITAGPFPVSPEGVWFLPAPADLVKDDTGDSAVKVGTRLVKSGNPSSLPKPLTYALGATTPPSKYGQLPAWITAAAYRKYLAGEMPALNDFKACTDIGDTESRIGIGIDPDTQAQDGESIYSAQYLRLYDGWQIGGFAAASYTKSGDQIKTLLEKENNIVIGGQQGICSISGKFDDAQSDCLAGLSACAEINSRFIKWALLAPAVFPEIAPDESRNIRSHPGGWLPNWIDPENGKVLLRETTERRQSESRADWRKRVRESAEISGRLIAARIPDAIEISGWSLLELEAKPTQLAVPAGAVYYFECADKSAAQKLAVALNFPNRRSTLWGEKGFGIGVCAPVAESEILK